MRSIYVPQEHTWRAEYNVRVCFPPTSENVSRGLHSTTGMFLLYRQWMNLDKPRLTLIFMSQRSECMLAFLVLTWPQRGDERRGNRRAQGPRKESGRKGLHHVSDGEDGGIGGRWHHPPQKYNCCRDTRHIYILVYSVVNDLRCNEVAYRSTRGKCQ